jgi:hypothetical protein
MISPTQTRNTLSEAGINLLRGELGAKTDEELWNLREDLAHQQILTALAGRPELHLTEELILEIEAEEMFREMRERRDIRRRA